MSLEDDYDYGLRDGCSGGDDCTCLGCAILRAEAEPRPTLVEYRRVVEALNLCLSALQRHDDWCGHRKNSPGDSIYRRAEEAAKKALWPTS